MTTATRKQDADHCRQAFHAGHKPPRGLHAEKDFRGNPIWTYRERHGPRIRIKETFGTQAFLDAYYAARHQYGRDASPAEAPLAKKKLGHADPASLQWLIDRYLVWHAAPAQQKSHSTQKGHRNTLTRVGLKYGCLPYRLVDRKHVVELRDGAVERGTPSMGNRVLSVVAALYDWAINEEKLLPEGSNPCDGVKRIEIKSESRHKWTDAECLKFEAAYKPGTLPRLAYDLYCFTGQRTSDVVKMGPQHLDHEEELMTIVQQKTGKEAIVPILPELLAAIEAAETAGILGKETFIGSARYNGRAMSADGFGNLMRTACDAIGIPECTPHGLRHKATMRCVENGADMGFLCSVFGYTPVVAQKYIDDFNGKETVKRGAHFLKRRPNLRVVKAA
jgi:integrase